MPNESQVYWNRPNELGPDLDLHVFLSWCQQNGKINIVLKSLE